MIIINRIWFSVLAIRIFFYSVKRYVTSENTLINRHKLPRHFRKRTKKFLFLSGTSCSTISKDWEIRDREMLMYLLNVALLTRDWSVCDLSNRRRFSLLCCWSSLCLNLASLSCCAGSWNGKQCANAVDKDIQFNAVNGLRWEGNEILVTLSMCVRTFVFAKSLRKTEF